MGTKERRSDGQDSREFNMVDGRPTGLEIQVSIRSDDGYTLDVVMWIMAFKTHDEPKK
jgi:hypothetical protein